MLVCCCRLERSIHPQLNHDYTYIAIIGQSRIQGRIKVQVKGHRAQVGHTVAKAGIYVRITDLGEQQQSSGFLQH